MHAEEVDIDLPLVRALLAAQFPAWAYLPIRAVGPFGTDNVLYRLGADMVVRLPRRVQDVATLIKERTWLPRLAPLLPLAIPTPLAHGMPGSGYPLEWSIYRWLDGESANLAPIADLRRAATDLAAFITEPQSIDTTGGPRPENDSARGVPLARRAAATRAAIAALHEEVDTVRVTASWEAALRAQAWHGPPVWFHGDLDARNLLVTNGRLSAVIDFGCLGVGDPACDVMVAWKLFTPAARHSFRTLLAVDEATWARSRGWALSQALLILAYYTPETNPVLVGEAKRWVANVLAD